METKFGLMVLILLFIILGISTTTIDNYYAYNKDMVTPWTYQIEKNIKILDSVIIETNHILDEKLKYHEN